MKAIINRETFEDMQTTGTFSIVVDDKHVVFQCKTLELPWLNNERQVSCIPEGEYDVIPRKSSKYGDHFYVKEVEGRSYILIHAGNYHSQIKGCILIGDKLVDIDGDSYKDVTNSKATLKKLVKFAPNGFTLTIK